MENFNKPDPLEMVKRGMRTRNRVANMAESAIRVIAKKHKLEETDVDEAVKVAHFAITEDPQEVVEDKLLQTGLDAAIRFLEERGLYTENLKTDITAKGDDFLLYKIKS